MCTFSHQAYANYQKRNETFGYKIDDAISKDIETCLKQSRVTILQYRMFQAVLINQENPEEAKKQINAQIAPRALQMANIVPLKDVNSTLWAIAADILKGKIVPVS